MMDDRESIITDKDILADFEQLIQIESSTQTESGFFVIKTANQWIDEAKNRPVPRMLFSEFWHEGEVCILFADTNLGKSILAVQIADSISKGKAIHGFKMEAEKQPVLYFDFELSDKQFEARYSRHFSNHYIFDSNLMRVEINPDAALPEGYNIESIINEHIEKSVETTGAKVLIVDNITYLRNETEKAKDALPLMKHLKEIGKRYGLSVLALAHTPKRDMYKPLSRNDIHGSKMLMNFCDSSFAIGESQRETNLRYIKQIKQRFTEQKYGGNNVCVCKIDKPSNFLGFEFIEHGSESDHLKEYNERDKTEREKRVLDLSAKGKTAREIADELNVSHTTVNRILSKSQDTQPEKAPF